MDSVAFAPILEEKTLFLPSTNYVLNWKRERLLVHPSPAPTFNSHSTPISLEKMNNR